MTYFTIALVPFIFILITDIIVVLNSFIGVSNGSTAIVAALNFITVLCLLKLSSRFSWNDKLPKKGLLLFKLFMAWSLFAFIRGAFNAKDYWDWKILLLNYSFSILVPLAIVVGLNHEVSVRIFRFSLKKLLLFGFIIVPFALTTNFELYARAMTVVSLLLLFVPYLKPRWRVLIFIVAIVSISMDVSYRANTLRIMFPVFLLCIYFYRNSINTKALNLLLSLTLCVPLILLLLGVIGQFNVFTDNPFDYKVKTGSESRTEITNLSTDTRTFLYQEVISSMVKRESSFIIGEGGGAGYETDWFADTTLNERGRYGSEVGFLNTLLYSGAVGVFLYALMLFVSAYYAINQSNNFLCKMLGLFLAFHWMMFFIEDITKMDLNFFFIWIAIGLCLSHRFRALTDGEVKQFFYLYEYELGR